MQTKKIKVGLDFDGVVAYNPFRLVRAPIAYFKRNILGIKRLSFFYPKNKWQRFFWVVSHESSIFPARGVDLLKRLVKDEKIEAHLVTARYSFLDDHLDKWLNKYKLKRLFKTINMNKKDEQPHLFKEKLINKFKFDFYIEDNFDIVKYLTQNSKLKTQNSNSRIFWIYNILDRYQNYIYKFPYLDKALLELLKQSLIKE